MCTYRSIQGSVTNMEISEVESDSDSIETSESLSEEDRSSMIQACLAINTCLHLSKGIALLMTVTVKNVLLRLETLQMMTLSMKIAS